MAWAKIVVSDICTAFAKQTIGSKVLFEETFMGYLEQVVLSHDGSNDRVPGQHFIVLPEKMHELVSAGDGLKSDNPDDYVVRHHREGPKMFLKRHLAGEVKFLAAVVYTWDAYLEDPDVTAKEIDRILTQHHDPKPTHVLVAVIASSGPSAPVTPFRFVHNLAGGNNEYLPPKLPESEDPGFFLDYHVWKGHCEELEGYITGIIGKAREVKEYWTKYGVVAD
jgi:hypothetical protein